MMIPIERRIGLKLGDISMHFRGLDLNLLVVLDALLTEQNTTRAGEIVYLGQSATSAALARLREFFGDPLLVRSGQKMGLTPLARELVEPVRHVLRETETIANCNLRFDPRASTRVFRVNMSDYVATVMLPSLIKEIKNIAPAVRLETIMFTGNPAHGSKALRGAEMHAYLEMGDVDFLLALRHLTAPHHPNEDLFTDHFVGVVWSGNRLVKKKLSLDQFLSMPHVAVRLGPLQTHTFDEIAIHEAGYERRIEVILPSFTSIPSVLLGTDFIAIMHYQLARFYQKFMPLTILPLPLELPPFNMQLQWHRYHDHDPGTIWFRDLMKRAAKEAFKFEPTPKDIGRLPK